MPYFSLTPLPLDLRPATKAVVSSNALFSAARVELARFLSQPHRQVGDIEIAIIGLDLVVVADETEAIFADGK